MSADGSKPSLWSAAPRVLVLSWVILSLAIGIGGWFRGMRTVLPGPSALETLQRYPGEQAAFQAGIPPKDSLTLIIGSKDNLFDDPNFKKATDELVELLRTVKSDSGGEPLFHSVRTLGHTVLFDDKELFVSDDEHALLLLAKTNLPLFASAQEFRKLPDLFNSWQSNFPDFFLGYLSEGTADNEIFELINKDLDRSLIYTLPLTLLILFFAFRSFVAALIPLFISIVSLIASLGLSAFFSHFSEPVSATAAQLVVLLVLAIGVDYSLVMVSRVREEIARGCKYIDAVRIARATTGTAVIWSGVTVACSLFGLLLMNDTILTSMAHVSIVAVFFTVISTVLIIPSLLLILERFIEPSKSSERTNSPWLKLSVRYPVKALLLSAGGMLILSIPLFFMNLGSTMEQDILPKSMQSSQAYALLEQYFPKHVGTSFWLIANRATAESMEEEPLDLFFDKLLAHEQVSGPYEVEYSEDRTVARYKFIAKGNGNDPANQHLISEIRSVYIPEILNPAGIQGYVTGVLTFVTDEVERYNQRTPLVLAVVLALSFLFLLVAFRSLAIAIKAILLNLLSASAAFAILVVLFQSSLIPGYNYGVIETFVPALLFSILFGLSMDYHIFLLSRIKEEADKGISTSDSIERGIASTYRIITSAALIMAGVFFIIANLELPIMKQLGLGLATAVLLDATIIRSILLPSSMVLLGRWNWYLPSWLQWLPKIKLGE